MSGPVIRGSGVPWDLRVVRPYSGYKGVFFNVPVGQQGDSYSRYLVRLAEMRESINIIQQCLKKLANNRETGQISYANKKYSSLKVNTLNTSAEKLSMEELIQEFKGKSRGFDVPAGLVYSSVEAPKGETGVLLMGDGSNKPYRCKIKAPGFLHLQALTWLPINLLIADVVTIIGSLDIVFGEVDR